MKIIPVQQAPSPLTLYFLENKDTELGRSCGLMSLGTPALASMLRDPLLKFIKPLLRAQHVVFFLEPDPYI